MAFSSGLLRADRLCVWSVFAARLPPLLIEFVTVAGFLHSWILPACFVCVAVAGFLDFWIWFPFFVVCVHDRAGSFSCRVGVVVE